MERRPVILQYTHIAISCDRKGCHARFATTALDGELKAFRDADYYQDPETKKTYCPDHRPERSKT